MSRDLTDQQKKFLELIFQPEYKNNQKQAAIDAGYSPNTLVNNIITSLKKEILEKVDDYLASKAPDSAMRIIDVLHSPEMKGAKAVLEASAMILDRVGISKKERLEVEVKAASGIILLPSKKD